MTHFAATNSFSRSLAILTLACLIVTGCSRKWYRKSADRDAACLLESRQFDSRWDIPNRVVEPDYRSRMADVNDPDCGPLPPDDAAARQYMDRPYGSKRRVEYWDRRGTGAMVDAEQWLEYLPYNDDGEVVLTKELAVDLALLHSRSFQAQVEQLYLQALSLSQSRFAFDIQWAGGTGATINADGAEGVPRTVGNPSRLSASRNFAAGGQLVVDLLNSVSYQIGGGEANFATGNLLFRLTQPLLRNAFRHVRTEGLTQSERSLLYSVRDFARFRRQFYLQIVQQYFSLLSQSQQIRIEEENIRNLNLNLERAEVVFKQGFISQIQIDQIFQNRQNGRISLISARQSLQAAMDQFKFDLGLPAKIKIKLDESFLDPFKLNSDAIEKLSADGDKLANSLRKYTRNKDEMPMSFVKQSYATLRQLHARAEALRPGIGLELERWKQKLEKEGASAGNDLNQQDELDFQNSLAARVSEDVVELERDLKRTLEQIDECEASPFGPPDDIEVEAPRPETEEDDPEAPPRPRKPGESNLPPELQKKLDELAVEEKKSAASRAFDRLERVISKYMVQDINQLFVSQTKIRLFLIDIKPVDIEEAAAVEIALRNRLDLMNDKARVVDSYRAVEIAADQLESDLNLTASADLRTDDQRDNGIRFDGESSRYSVGLQFDGPLNRLAERNSYRSAQISYQQQRRAYMAAEDSIVNAIRADLRSLTQNKFNFQTNRQQLIAATRQVDQTRQQALNSTEEGDSSATQDLLQALSGLRSARSGLISSWVSYEVSRISLFVDLELLLLDDSGRWTNGNETLDYGMELVSDLLPTDQSLEAIDPPSPEMDVENAERNETDSPILETDAIESGEAFDVQPDLNPRDNETFDPKPVNETTVNGNESSQENWPRGPERISRRFSNRRGRSGSDSNIIRE